MPGDVEGVALAIAEAVDDGAAIAALLVDGLLERLGFAPVSLQVFALRHMQGLLAGLQHLLPGHGGATPLAPPPVPGARLLGRLSLLGVIVLGLVWRGDGTLGPLLFPFSSWQQGPQEEKQGSHSVGGAAHAVSAAGRRGCALDAWRGVRPRPQPPRLDAGSAGWRETLSPHTGSPGPRRAHRVRGIAQSPV